MMFPTIFCLTTGMQKLSGTYVCIKVSKVLEDGGIIGIEALTVVLGSTSDSCNN